MRLLFSSFYKVSVLTQVETEELLLTTEICALTKNLKKKTGEGKNYMKFYPF